MQATITSKMPATSNSGWSSVDVLPALKFHHLNFRELHRIGNMDKLNQVKIAAWKWAWWFMNLIPAFRRQTQIDVFMSLRIAWST